MTASVQSSGAQNLKSRNQSSIPIQKGGSSRTGGVIANGVGGCAAEGWESCGVDKAADASFGLESGVVYSPTSTGKETSNTSAEALTNDNTNITSTSAAGAAQVRIAGGKVKTKTPAVIGKYKDVVKEYSKGVTPGTVCEYEVLMKQLVTFLVQHEFIKPDEDFFSSTPHEDAAYIIVTWIMNRYFH
uniref:Uncharacterized protein n=1 Tax=Moniliophthora roreri TaxID=221103 RepID=A0A0W0FBU5_MONRR